MAVLLLPVALLVPVVPVPVPHEPQLPALPVLVLVRVPPRLRVRVLAQVLPEPLPLLHLADLYELRAGRRFGDPERIYVVIVGLAQHRVGLVVDELLGQQDVVIKPLVRALRSVPGIAGATELGGGRTVRGPPPPPACVPADCPGL